MAEEQTQIIDPPAPAGKSKLWLFAGLGVVVVALGAGAWLFLASPGTADAESAPVAEKPSSKPPIYQSLHPALVVNFKDEAGDAHYMQITMEVMSRDQAVINAVREHTPAIRNALILLYSGAIFENVETRAGKEKMLADGRAEIERIVAEASGERGVEALYFTSLVIQ